MGFLKVDSASKNNMYANYVARNPIDIGSYLATTIS